MKLINRRLNGYKSQAAVTARRLVGQPHQTPAGATGGPSRFAIVAAHPHNRCASSKHFSYTFRPRAGRPAHVNGNITGGGHSEPTRTTGKYQPSATIQATLSFCSSAPNGRQFKFNGRENDENCELISGQFRVGIQRERTTSGLSFWLVRRYRRQQKVAFVVCRNCCGAEVQSKGDKSSKIDEKTTTATATATKTTTIIVVLPEWADIAGNLNFSEGSELQLEETSLIGRSPRPLVGRNQNPERHSDTQTLGHSNKQSHSSS